MRLVALTAVGPFEQNLAQGSALAGSTLAQDCDDDDDNGYDERGAHDADAEYYVLRVRIDPDYYDAGAALMPAMITMTSTTIIIIMSCNDSDAQ